jgi:hypothetical protein
VKHNRSRLIEGIAAFLSRDDAQTKPETAVTLSVISGSSVLAFSRLSDNAAATAVARLVRLFF